MSGTKKRLDLQFGAFACSVQGFDDPVQPVQQVLQALQNLLEETPDLADASISFDADAIDRLIGEVARRADIDEDMVDIVPGLIIVHRSDEAAGPAEGGEAEDEAWSRPFVAGGGASEETLREEDSAPQYVNIFASTTDAGAEPSADHGDAGGGGDSFGDRLHRIAPEAPGEEEDTAASVFADAEAGAGAERSIFAEAGDAGGGSVFADPMAGPSGAASAADSAAPVNLFAEDSGYSDAGSEALSSDGPSGLNLFAEPPPGEMRAGPEEDSESTRVEHLFGGSENQPEAEAEDEGYTAASLAESAGAQTVPELMVAAAAWMVLLQGQTGFSRREVIDVFETIPGDHPNTLEAQIKGFGKAVRNGQFVMIEDGVFGLSRAELERFQSLL